MTKVPCSSAVNINIINPQNFANCAPRPGAVTCASDNCQCPKDHTYDYQQSTLYTDPCQNKATMPMPVLPGTVNSQLPPLVVQQPVVELPPPVIAPKPQEIIEEGNNKPADKSTEEVKSEQQKIEPKPDTPPVAESKSSNAGDEINKKLTSKDLKVQYSGIEQLDSISKDGKIPEELVRNEQIFQNLSSILEDKTVYEGENKEQAEKNKIIATSTLAKLQKEARRIIDADAKANGFPPVILEELPGSAQILANLKENPSAKVREESLKAINAVADKEKDIELLKMIYGAASNADTDASVRDLAGKYLNELNKPA